VSFPKLVCTLSICSFLLLSIGVAAADEVEISFYRATLQRNDDQLLVKEAYSFTNSSDEELTPPNGLSFELPYQIEGTVTAVVSSEGSRRQLKLPMASDGSTRRGLDTKLVPGRTSITLSYSAKYPGKLDFSPSFDYPVATLDVFVQPMDMVVEGSGAKRESSSVMAGFATYTLPALNQKGQIHLALSGGSAAPPPTAAAPPTVTPPAQEEKWQVMIKPNRFGESQSRILIFLFLGVVLGFGLLYALSFRGDPQRDQSAKSKRQVDLQHLEDRYVSGNLSREAFLEQRERLLKRNPPKAKGPAGRKPVGKA